MDANTEKIICRLPEELRNMIENLPSSTTDKLEEIRLKADEDSLLICGGREINLHDRPAVTPEVLGGYT